VLITVWRHGEAGPAPSDWDRQLTSRGRASLQIAAADFHRWLGSMALPMVSACLHSPLVRTTQTAELLSTILPCLPEPCSALEPGRRREEVDRVVPEGESHLLLVSHQPLVSRLIDYWLDSNEVAPLSPGGYATLDVTIPTRGGASLVKAQSSILQ